MTKQEIREEIKLVKRLIKKNGEYEMNEPNDHKRLMLRCKSWDLSQVLRSLDKINRCTEDDK